jgi:hypothetical protein
MRSRRQRVLFYEQRPARSRALESSLRLPTRLPSSVGTEVIPGLVELEVVVPRLSPALR